METEPEPDEMWTELSVTRNGYYEQFVLFLMEGAEVVYSPYVQPVRKERRSPEVAWPGEW